MRAFLRFSFLSLLIFLIGAWIAINSNYLQEQAAIYVSKRIETETGLKIKIKTLAFTLPCKIVAHQIAIGEENNPLCQIERSIFNFSLTDLLNFHFPLSYHVIVRNLKMDRKIIGSGNAVDFINPNFDLEGVFEFDPESSNTIGSFTTTASLGAKSIKIHNQILLTKEKNLHLSLGNEVDDFLALSGDLFLSPEFDLEGTNFQLRAANLNFDSKEHPLFCNEANAICSLSGPLSDMKAAFDISIKNLRWQSYLIENLKGSGIYSTLEKTGNGNFYLSTPHCEKKIEASADLQWLKDDVLSISDITISAPDNLLKGNLSLFFLQPGIEGQLNGFIHDFSIYEAWLPTKIRGKADCTLNFSRDCQSVDLILAAPELSIADTHLHKMDLNLKINDIFENPHTSLKLQLGSVKHEECLIENVSFQTETHSSLTNCPYTLNFSGKWHESFLFQSKGEWSSQSDSLILNIQKLTGNAVHIPFSLTQPTSFKLNSEIFELTPTFLDIGQTGKIVTSVSKDQTNIRADLDFHNIPIEFIHLGSPFFPLKGLITGKGFIKGLNNSPSLQFIFEGDQLRIEEKSFAKLPFAKGIFELQADRQGLSLSGSILTPDYAPIHFNGSLPVFFSFFPLDFRVNKDDPFNGLISATGEIEPFLQLLFTDTTAISGLAKTSLEFFGTLNAPKLSGTCDIYEGTFENPKLGTVLRHLNAHIEASGETITLKNLNAVGSQEGSVSGSGYLILNQEKKFPFTIDLLLNQVALLTQDYMQASFDGNLSLKGDSEHGNLAGALTLTQGEIQIPEQTTALMNTVEVTYTNISDTDSQPQQIKTPLSSWPLTLNIEMNIPENLTIAGKDLTSDWKGDITITGTTDAPLLNGEIEVRGGHYIFNGKPFEINHGTITLSGDLEKKTLLYIIATKDLDKVKVDVILKGPIKTPSISFRSNPPLPQREILSWLLFNRGTSEISPFQGSQLSESITNLDNNHQGPDVLTKIRNALGIDRFEICRDSHSDTNGMSLQVGKYISDNVFISVNKSDVNRLAIEAALTKKIKLQAEIGDDSEGQLLLKWKRDY